MFVAWPEIESFANMRKAALKYEHITELIPENGITYRGKIKLHGTNAAIRVNTNGARYYQSRGGNITVENDNAGFAKFASNLSKLTIENNVTTDDYILYGEWFGRGINNGAAACQIQEKRFAIFSIYYPGVDLMIFDPDVINCILPNISKNNGVDIIPWFDSLQHADIRSEESLNSFVNYVNGCVESVEKNDPWISSCFGVNGVGEGIVYYPTNVGVTMENISHFIFKAKGEKHRVKETQKAASVELIAPETINEFCNMFVTQARLAQGLSITSPDGKPEMKDLGNFLKWMNNDIIKESKLELEASSIEWKSVAKTVTDRCRTWFMKTI